jgi:hypothetical protein
VKPAKPVRGENKRHPHPAVTRRVAQQKRFNHGVAISRLSFPTSAGEVRASAELSFKAHEFFYLKISVRTH